MKKFASMKSNRIKSFEFHFVVFQQCNQMLKTESEESELCDITQNQPMELTTNSSMDHHRPPDFHFNSLPPDHPLSLLPHHRGRQVKEIKKLSDKSLLYY